MLKHKDNHELQKLSKFSHRTSHMCTILVATEWEVCSYHSGLCILHANKHARPQI